jgi:transposase
MIHMWCWIKGGQPLMTAPLSNDLRHRVVKAIEGGLSRRAAAVKFDVSIASAVRWYQRFKRTGSIEPDAIGGDHHSYRAEAHATRVLAWIDEQRDLTLVEIRDRLAEEGHVFAPATIWRLLDRHDYTLKKRLPMPVSRNAMM